MKANVVFKHQREPCAVLRVDDDEYFVVSSKYYTDMAQADNINGDLTMLNVKWLLNLTSSTLLDVKVLGRYTTLQLAIHATTVPAATTTMPIATTAMPAASTAMPVATLALPSP